MFRKNPLGGAETGNAGSPTVGDGRVSRNLPSLEALELSKQRIRARVVETVKDLQIEFADQSHYATCIETNHISSGFVSAVESIFVHGLRAHFMTGGELRKKRAPSKPNDGAAAGSPSVGTGVSWVMTKLADSAAAAAAAASSSYANVDQIQPNFWTFLMVYSHSGLIELVEGLSQIHTDAGRCRAWIRLSLNEGSFCQYLHAISNDPQKARRHYGRGAILRDHDALDVINRYLYGVVEVYRFRLATNSGLLNRWPLAPVELGLGVKLAQGDGEVGQDLPAQRPVLGVDAAATLDKNGVDQAAARKAAVDQVIRDHHESFGATSILIDEKGNIAESGSPDGEPPGFLLGGLLNEDEALRIILQGGCQIYGPLTPYSASPGAQTSYSCSPFSNGKNLGGLPAVDDKPEPPSSQAGPSPAAAAAIPVPDSAKAVVRRSKSDENSGGSDDRSNLNESSSSDSEDTENSSDFDFKHSIYSSNYVAPPRPAPFNGQADDKGALSSGSGRSSSVRTIRPCDEACIEDDADGDFAKVVVVMNKDEKDLKNGSSSSLTLSPATSRRKASSSSRSTKKPRKTRNPPLSGFIHSWRPFHEGRPFELLRDPPRKRDGKYKAEEADQGFKSKDGGLFFPGLHPDDSRLFMRLFDQIPSEGGVENQNYQCFDCLKAVGSIFGKARVCGYTKKYYCNDCLTNRTSCIPAKVVLNWDFKQYPVSNKVADFLMGLWKDPLIELPAKIKADLCEFSKEFAGVCRQRRRLKFMLAYLTTCAGTKVSNRRSCNPGRIFERIVGERRKYLFECEELISMADFEDIKSGRMKIILGEAEDFGTVHILKDCVLCAGRGFICEVCQDPKPIYPFDLDVILQCKGCLSIYHKHCFKIEDGTPEFDCPKCERRLARKSARAAETADEDGDTEMGEETLEEIRIYGQRLPAYDYRPS